MYSCTFRVGEGLYSTGVNMVVLAGEPTCRHCTHAVNVQGSVWKFSCAMHNLLLIIFICAILCSWADSFHLHATLHEWLGVFFLTLNIHWSGALTARAWLVPLETAAIFVRYAPCHCMQSHRRSFIYMWQRTWRLKCSWSTGSRSDEEASGLNTNMTYKHQ